MIDLTKKKILVTGGAGFLGSACIAALLERGVAQNNIFAPVAAEFDLRRIDDCTRAIQGQQIIFHFAAAVGDIVQRTEESGSLFYDNLLIGAELLEASRLAGVEKVVTIGTATEYPEVAPVPLVENDLWSGPQSAVNLSYGFPKKAMLVQGQLYRKQYKLNVIHLILTNVYGPQQTPQAGRMLPTVIQRIVEAHRTNASTITMWGSGTPTRDFLFIDDAMAGILSAAEQYDDGEPVNLGTGAAISIQALVAEIVRLVGYRGTVAWDATKPDGQLHCILDPSRARALFGFEPRTSFAEGLPKMVAAYLAR